MMDKRYFIERAKFTSIPAENEGVAYALHTGPGFSRRDVHFTPEVAKRIFNVQQEYMIIQEYLYQLYGTSQYVLDRDEGPKPPTFLKEAPSGKPKVQKKQATSK